MKFGKYLAKRQLDLPEYAQYFIDYKGLKKVRLFGDKDCVIFINLEVADKTVVSA